MKQTWMSLLGWMLIFLGANSSALALNVVGYDGEPFYFKNGSQGISGACHDIVREICHRQNLSCKFRIAQIPKIIAMMKSGEVDISCPLARSPEREEFIHFSDKIFKTRYSFFAKAEDASKLNSLDDFRGFSVSVFAPSATSQALHRLNKNIGNIFTVIEERSEMTSLQKAEKVGKTLSFINNDIAHSWILRSKSPLVELAVGNKDLHYHIGMSKKTVSEEIRKKILETYATLQKEKFVEKTAQTYGLKVPEAESINNMTPKTESTFP